MNIRRQGLMLETLLKCGTLVLALMIPHGLASSARNETLVIAQGSAQRVITVNRVRLSQATIQQLERAYRTRLISGHFWYDRVSGLWGIWGGPALGQVVPWLRLGGPLPWNASGGATRVFVNGRAIHPLERDYLLRVFGRVPDGRYWLNAQGVGGLEGRAASFNLGAAASSGNDWIRRTPGGTVGGDGNCSYYSHPNGSSVMVGPGC
jgi:hypothetical protein